MNARFKVSSRQDPWAGFKDGEWIRKVDVRGFIQANYTPYAGDSAFLAAASERTTALWAKVQQMLVQEQKKGVLEIGRAHV